MLNGGRAGVCVGGDSPGFHYALWKEKDDPQKGACDNDNHGTVED